MGDTGTERTLEALDRLENTAASADYADGFEVFSDAEEVRAALRHLEAQVERYREDGERLDWLETQRNRIGGIGMLKGTNAWGISAPADTLREAVDAARKETP